MSERAEATFEFDSWDGEDVSAEGGTSIQRVVFVKRLQGQITGTSTGWMTMARHEGGGAAYSGTELYDVMVNGRAGTFVAQHNASGDPESGFSSSITILPGSGSGDLTALAGTIEITQDGGAHAVSLHYTLD